jgi:hypothetical protein
MRVERPANDMTPAQPDRRHSRRALKTVPVAAIEAAIAGALRDLVGADYVVDVRQLAFEPTPGAIWSGEVSFSVRTTRRRPRAGG